MHDVEPESTVRRVTKASPLVNMTATTALIVILFLLSYVFVAGVCIDRFWS